MDRLRVEDAILASFCGWFPALAAAYFLKTAALCHERGIRRPLLTILAYVDPSLHTRVCGGVLAGCALLVLGIAALRPVERRDRWTGSALIASVVVPVATVIASVYWECLLLSVRI